MFNIAGFHIPKQIAFKSGAAILEKLGWDHEGLKPLGAVNTVTITTTTLTSKLSHFTPTDKCVICEDLQHHVFGRS